MKNHNLIQHMSKVLKTLHLSSISVILGFFLTSQVDAANPPTQVTVTPLSSTSARVNWRNPSGTIQAVQIYQSRNGAAYVFGENVPPGATSAVRDGLTAGADYCFQVRVQIGGQWSSFSSPACYDPVPPPTSVAASVQSFTSARVTWNNPGGSIDSIQIYQSQNGGGFSFAENVPPTLEAAVRDNLSAGSSYCFKVRVQVFGRWSVLSASQGCVTLELPPVPVPTSVSATAISSTSSRVSWVNPPGTIEAIQVYQSRDGASFVFAENVPPDRTSAVRDSLDPEVPYCFKVRVQIGGRWSDLSAAACVTQPAVPLPTGVTASVLSSTSARISWNNPSATIEAIQIYQSENGGGFVFAENVPPDRTSAVRDGLTPSVQYCFRVRVQISGRWSNLSSPACVTQPGIPVPAGVTVSVVSSTSARVSWNNPSEPIEAIQIYQNVNGGGFVFAENVPPDRTSAIRDGLNPEVQYCFKVRVQIAGRWSDYSSAACVLMPPIPVPTSVTAAAIDFTSARINWRNPSETIDAIQIYQSLNGGGFAFGENVPPTLESAVRDNLTPGSDYCFKVRVQIAGRWSELSPSQGCVTLESPPVPVLVSPDNGSIGVPVSATFDWRSISAASGYDYQIYQGSTLVHENTGGPVAASYVELPLEYDTSYRWRIRARVIPQNNPWSDYWTFRTKPPPGPPDQLTPTNGTSGMGSSVRLDWSALAGASGYDYEVYEDGVLHDKNQNGPIAATAYTVATRKHHNYKWRIRGRVLPQNNPWSEFWRFDTIPSIDPPSPVSPANYTQDVQTPVTLAWTPVEGADYYEVEAYEDDVLSFQLTGLSGLAVSISPLPEVFVTWQVRAHTSQGYTDWSDFSEFTTAPLPLTAYAELVEPLEGDTYPAGRPIVLQAEVFSGDEEGNYSGDPSSQVSSVQFFSNGIFLGQATTPPYTFTWTPSAMGTNELLVKTLTGAGQLIPSEFTTAIEVSAPANPPQIVVQPTNQVVLAGDSVTFYLSAAGSSSLTYQWQQLLATQSLSGVSLEWQNINGANLSAYSLQAVSQADERSFRCLVTSAGLTTISYEAELWVIAPINVTLSQPKIGDSFAVGTSISVSADFLGNELDISQAVEKVELYNGLTKIGEAPPTAPTWTLSNLPTGLLQLQVRPVGPGIEFANSAIVPIRVSIPNSEPIHLSILRIENNPPTIVYNSLIGATYLIEGSHDLNSWTVLAEIMATDSRTSWSQGTPATGRNRFYRIKNR